MAKQKYVPLTDFLSKQSGDVTLSFEEVARLLGCMETKIPPRLYSTKTGCLTFTKDDLAKLIANAEYRLPPSAYEFGAWWRSSSKVHCFADAWESVGYKAYPDMDKQEVTFR